MAKADRAAASARLQLQASQCLDDGQIRAPAGHSADHNFDTAAEEHDHRPRPPSGVHGGPPFCVCRRTRPSG
ncbi:MAG: hypothetical protein M3Y04_00775, partial [Actinomycetota bacterium]|nr:hypothetical protein [Actinomycetota bacterium]